MHHMQLNQTNISSKVFPASQLSLTQKKKKKTIHNFKYKTNFTIQHSTKIKNQHTPQFTIH
jgi:hypothetical protein